MKNKTVMELNHLRPRHISAGALTGELNCLELHRHTNRLGHNKDNKKL